MNGFERIVAALECRQPDQIPLMEWLIDPKVVNALCPDGDLFDFVEQMDLDGVSVGGRHFPRHSFVTEEVFVDVWGVRFKRTAEAYAPVEGPIKSEADLERFMPPDPYDETLVADLKKAVKRFKGKKFICYHSRAEFSSAAQLRGLPELLMDFVVNPKLVHGVMKIISDYYCTVARLAIEAGADAIMFGDDWAFKSGPMMSPTHFREFVLLYFRRAVQVCKEAGGYAIKHSDGNLWPIIDMVVESGIDCLNPIQPDAGMDIGEVKQKYGKNLCIAGNINCGYTLTQAPVEEVVQEVKEAIRKAGPGGGYIMMSSNSLHSGVKPENYRAMVETTRTYGRYPLDMAALL